MEDLFVLGAVLIVVSIPIALIYLLVSHGRLKTRVNDLEKQLLSMPSQLSGLQTGTPAAQPEKPRPEVAKPPAPRAAAAATEAPAETVSRPSLREPAKPGPWSPAVKPPSPPPPAPDRAPGAAPRAFVFRQDKFAAFSRWLVENWFLAIAALSLALAGVFLVQYGVEHGVLTPFWRVMGALAMGAALVVTGEVLRRRFGDASGGSVDYLPSTFSGAGLVTLFAGVLAARQLYDLIGPETALIALVAVSLLGVVLGWFYGPMLAAVGILGSVAAPFLVGGSSDTPYVFFYSFLFIAVAGLLIDTLKRWAWVSAFVLILTFAAAWMFFATDAGDAHYMVFALGAAAAAITIPVRQLVPRHDGPSVLGALLARTAPGTPRAWPEFPTRIASASFAAATAAVLMVAAKDSGAAETWLAIAALAALSFAALLWLRHAPALRDLALLAPLAVLAVLVMQAADYGTLFSTFRAGVSRLPEAAPPMTVTYLALIALATTALAANRARLSRAVTIYYTAGAALFAPLALVTLEVLWMPTDVLGAYQWAGHAIVTAALMVLLAERASRAAHMGMRHAALYALSALTMISFALILVLSDIALTLALAVMVLIAALIDRRLDMRPLGLFVQAGGVLTGWRLVIDPGVYWAAEHAALWEILLAYGGAIALFSAAWVMLKQRARTGAIVVMESAVWLFVAILLGVLLYRAMGREIDNHWGMSLMSMVWLLSAFNQLYRLKMGGPLRIARIVLASVFGGFAALGLLMAVTVFNPLVEFYRNEVFGPWVLDTLFVAYGLPALALALAAWKLTHVWRLLRQGFTVLAAGFAALYTTLEIRRAWHGGDLSSGQIFQGEQYSYTVALLVVAAALLFLSFLRRSVLVRKLALIGIGLTIAKVFLVDMSDTTGLIRVASFLGLGLSLAGLAWVNRLMIAQWDRKTGAEGQDAPDDDA